MTNSSRFNPKAAQEGRRKMAERCIRIAKEETPENVSIAKYRTSLTGVAYRGKKTGQFFIKTPRPRTRKALYIYLHEIGHIVLGHCDPKARRKWKSWEREQQAEDFAHETMRKHGLAVPRSMTQRAKEYVAHKKEFGLRTNHRHTWIEYPEDFEQHGEWLYCSDKDCNRMKHIETGRLQ